MASIRLKPHQSFLLSVFLFGCLPGIILLVAFRVQNGELMMLGQSLGSYTMARILAAVLSPSAPLLLLLPLALTMLPPQLRGTFIGPAIMAPIMFILPTLVASFLIGARGLAVIGQTMLVLAVFNVNFCLWFKTLKRIMPMSLAVILFGTFWATSGFSDYIARYVAPHHDFIGLKMVVLVNWVLPQLGTAFYMIDEMLLGGGWQWQAILPTLLQLPILIALSLFLPMGNRDAIH